MELQFSCFVKFSFLSQSAEKRIKVGSGWRIDDSGLFFYGGFVYMESRRMGLQLEYRPHWMEGTWQKPRLGRLLFEKRAWQ